MIFDDATGIDIRAAAETRFPGRLFPDQLSHGW
jgi:hypothetical protein